MLTGDTLALHETDSLNTFQKVSLYGKSLGWAHSLRGMGGERNSRVGPSKSLYWPRNSSGKNSLSTRPLERKTQRIFFPLICGVFHANESGIVFLQGKLALPCPSPSLKKGKTTHLPFGQHDTQLRAWSPWIMKPDRQHSVFFSHRKGQQARKCQTSAVLLWSSYRHLWSITNFFPSLLLSFSTALVSLFSHPPLLV